MNSTLIYIVEFLLGVIAGLAPTYFAIRDKIKKIKTAKDATEKSEFTLELVEYAKKMIVEAEAMAKPLDTVCGSTGAFKKYQVMTRLELEAIRNGYEFDKAEWSKKVDEIVEMTKVVNVKKGA